MAVVRLSRLAEDDLFKIGQYTLDRWGIEQAIRYLADLEASCQRLAQNPGLGRSCEKIRPGLRRLEHGRHVIFYRLRTDGVLVSRILHDGMLPRRQIIEDE